MQPIHTPNPKWLNAEIRRLRIARGIVLGLAVVAIAFVYFGLVSIIIGPMPIH